MNKKCVLFNIVLDTLPIISYITRHKGRANKMKNTNQRGSEMETENKYSTILDHGAGSFSVQSLDNPDQIISGITLKNAETIQRYHKNSHENETSGLLGPMSLSDVFEYVTESNV